MFKYAVLVTIFLNTANTLLYSMHDVNFKGYSLRQLVEAKNNSEYSDRLSTLLQALKFQHNFITKIYQQQLIEQRMDKAESILNRYIPGRAEMIASHNTIEDIKNLRLGYKICLNSPAANALFIHLAKVVPAELKAHLSCNDLIAPQYLSEGQIQELKDLQVYNDENVQEIIELTLAVYDSSKARIQNELIATEMCYTLLNGSLIFASPSLLKNTESDIIAKGVYSLSYKPTIFNLGFFKKYVYLGYDIARRNYQYNITQIEASDQKRFTATINAYDKAYQKKILDSYTNYQSMQSECDELYRNSYHALKQVIKQLDQHDALEKTTLLSSLTPCLIENSVDSASSTSEHSLAKIHIPKKKKKQKKKKKKLTTEIVPLVVENSTLNTSIEKEHEATQSNQEQPAPANSLILEPESPIDISETNIDQIDQTEDQLLNNTQNYRLAPHILKWFNNPQEAFYDHGYTFISKANYDYMVLIHTFPLALIKLAFEKGLVIESPSDKGPYNDKVAYLAGELVLPNNTRIIGVYSARQNGLNKIIYHHGFTQKISGEALIQEYLDKRLWDVEYPPLTKEELSFDPLATQISPFATEEEFAIGKEDRLLLPLLLKRHNNVLFTIYKLVN